MAKISTFIQPPPMTPPTKKVLPAEPTILPKVWITKYALTRGVLTTENVVMLDPSSPISMIRTQDTQFRYYFRKIDWYLTEDEARVRVEEMVDKKMKSLVKAKLKLNRVLASLPTLPTKPLT